MSALSFSWHLTSSLTLKRSLRPLLTGLTLPSACHASMLFRPYAAHACLHVSGGKCPSVSWASTSRANENDSYRRLKFFAVRSVHSIVHLLSLHGRDAQFHLERLVACECLRRAPVERRRVDLHGPASGGRPHPVLEAGGAAHEPQADHRPALPLLLCQVSLHIFPLLSLSCLRGRRESNPPRWGLLSFTLPIRLYPPVSPCPPLPRGWGSLSRI